jgi:hypothetical protein
MSHSTTTIDHAFTSVLVEIGRLRHDIDHAAWCRHVRTVDEALARFCDAIDHPKPNDDASQLARSGFMAVLALAQLLHGTYSDDPRTATALELTQLAVQQLLDALEPYVTRADSEARRVLLDGEPLDAALARMFCA